MPSTYSTSLRLELMAQGENRNSWGMKANNDFNLIEKAITGYRSIAMTDANKTLTALNGADDESRNIALIFTGALTANRTVTIPSVAKTYQLYNNTTGGFSLVISTGSGSVTLTPGYWQGVVTNGVSIWLVPNVSISGVRWNNTARVDSAGVMEAGRYIDFHNTSASAVPFAVRLETNNTTTDFYAVASTGATANVAQKMWSAGNDGPGSGLNADLLDGFHATSFFFPSGTRLAFQQTAAPTGWTKDVTAARNNNAIRIVTGTASSGGSVDFTTVFADRGFNASTGTRSVSGSVAPATAGGTVGNTTLTLSQIPSHTHGSGTLAGVALAAGAHNHNPATAGATFWIQIGGGFAAVDGGSGTTSINSVTDTAPAHTHTVDVNSGATAAAGSGGAHGHTFTGTSHFHTWSDVPHNHTVSIDSWDLRIKYTDFIIAVKD